MITRRLKLTYIALSLLLCCAGFCPVARGQTDQWQLLLNNTGIVAMHMTLTHHNTVIMYDQAGSRSIEYDVFTNKARRLRIGTNLQCSSGAFLSNGTLVQTGGHHSGSQSIRFLDPCEDRKCSWRESTGSLSNDRWFASNQVLPESDSIIVVGGKKVFTYEFVPKLSLKSKSYDLPFLKRTYDENDGGLNLYPFLHLSSDGNLFIFANRDSILFNYKDNKVIKRFPEMPGDGSRNYPNTGSSVILPLHHQDNFTKVEVMVCGGGSTGAFSAAENGRYLEALKSCGRMVITGKKHEWKMENMPQPRLLNDMILLPTGHVLIINGAKRGSGGYDNAVTPSLHPYLYKPEEKQSNRFSILESTKIARMYLSSAILLPDGRVLVAGGNPHSERVFEDVEYPTELRLQAFVPHHMDQKFDSNRPYNVSIYGRHGGEVVEYKEVFSVMFLMRRWGDVDNVTFSAYAPPSTTHSNSMNQRMLVLRCTSLVGGEDGWVRALVEAPHSPNVAPPGYYLLTVVSGGIPSVSQWVRFVQGQQIGTTSA